MAINKAAPSVAAEFAPAKVNLTLHVTGQRQDGYHLLDSLVVFADVGDRITYTPSQDISITVSGPFADGVPVDDRNLIWRAAAHVGQGGRFHLEKHLPHGGGIGGGSSDAAAVLRLLADVTKADLPHDVAVLGADVPVCLRPAAQRMGGIGDHLTAVPAVPPLFAVLVNPYLHVATPQVFRALAAKENPPMAAQLPEWAGYDEFTDWLTHQRNDLQAAAISICPQIADVLTAIDGADVVRMSGSGSTCFGLYRSRAVASEAARAIAAQHPDWWVRDCALA